MHIAIIADSIDKQTAGIHYYTKNMIIHLLKNDTNNTYSIIKLNSNKIKDDITSITLENTFSFLRNDPYRTFISLPKLLRKLNPDVVIEPAHFGPFNLPKHIKRVTVIHDLTPLKFSTFHRFSSSFLQKIFFPLIINKADLLITNSKHTSKDVIQYFPNSSKKIKTIYLGKADFFKPVESQKVLDEYKINDPYFLTIGTIEPRKNFINLLEAYQTFREQNATRINLVIGGNVGWKSKSFFKKYFQHPYRNDIKLIGYAERADLPYLYSHAEAFIYPSYYEGFGLPVLEAMACGCPCIISNTSSLPEVGGLAVLYIDPFRPQSIVEKMELLTSSDNKKTKLKADSINQANKFSWGNFANEFIQILEKEFSNP
jgi:glycosyltransferase involved in cell wall biosynthesis